VEENLHHVARNGHLDARTSKVLRNYNLYCSIREAAKTNNTRSILSKLRLQVALKIVQSVWDK